MPFNGNKKQRKDIKNHAIKKLQEIEPDSVYGANLHSYLFSGDSFVVGPHAAKKWLGATVLDCVERICEYEEALFGEVTTPFDVPERIVNMFTYISGEALSAESGHLVAAWDHLLSKKDLDIIRRELRHVFEW